MKRKSAISSVTSPHVCKDSYVLEHFDQNKAYLFRKEMVENPEILLQEMKSCYQWYRKGWHGVPREAIECKLAHDFYAKMRVPPLSVDLEIAATCDLACQFCYRQHLATPDKYMDTNLALNLIDQCVELGVPSIKLNWRGEPLMHRDISRIVRYAKEKGILEVIINTNATNLTPEMSHELIESGLDIMIYSFEGGTPQTYNKMRIGRFKPNDFDQVYRNIRKFAEIRRELGSPFPFTKIQMILTEDTFNEQEAFYQLFDDCVDEITVKAYTERGGTLETLSVEEKEAIYHFRQKEYDETDLRNDLQYWKDNLGNLHIEDGRLPCEQIFQRLMISYDGRVFMCCYDWGNEYPVGFVSDYYFQHGDRDYYSVMESARKGKRGFERMNLSMPERRIDPVKTVQTLEEIWDGTVLNEIRELHLENKVDDVVICKKCKFKETYCWRNIEVAGV